MMSGEGGVTVGSPLIADAAVQGEIMLQMRAEKVYTFKKRRRKHSSARLKGHRQSVTVVKITDILASGAEASGVAAAVGAGSVAGGSVAAAAASGPVLSADSDRDGDVDADDGVRPSNLLDAPKGEADDLTKISGVGPKLNEKLNDNGIYHFWQIAEWGQAEIAFVDNLLSFKGRIERDEWIDQAKKLAAEAEKG